MYRKIPGFGLAFLMICSLAACGADGQPDAETADTSEEGGYESAEGAQIRMTAADGKAAMQRTVDGLRGYLECLPGAKEAGVIYGAGAWQLGDIQGNPAMEEAYHMGKAVC